VSATEYGPFIGQVVATLLHRAAILATAAMWTRVGVKHSPPSPNPNSPWRDHMHTELHHHSNIAQRLAARIRRRQQERMLHILAQNAEWCRQAQQAPPLSASTESAPGGNNATH